MSDIDVAIIKELLKDAQMPFTRIAKKLNISAQTVKRRYEIMKDQRIILQSSVTIDLSRLGYQGKVILMITNAPEHDKTATISALQKIRNVFFIAEIIGDSDMIAIAPVTDYKSIAALVNEVKNIPSVAQVEVTTINDTTFPINSRYGEGLVKKM